MDELTKKIIIALIVFIVIGITCGIIAGKKVKEKGKTFFGYFCIGFFLGILGVIITNCVVDNCFSNSKN